MQAFTVQIDAFHGPLDLLLHLVRKDEIPIALVPLADVTQQYLDFVAVIEVLDPDAVGDFLDVASLLLEIKSRAVLPAAENAAEGDAPDGAPIESTADLVQRLLEFKEYRDAAARLETLRLDWSKRRTRIAPSGGPPTPSPRPVAGIELWDLVHAFGRVLRAREAEAARSTIFYDDTPIHVFMQRVHAQLAGAPAGVSFEGLFPEGPVHRSTLVSVFLAVLELIRHGHALAEQPERYGPITLRLGEVPLPAL